MDLISYIFRIYLKKRYFSSPLQLFLLIGVIALGVLQALMWSFSSSYVSQGEEIEYMKISLLITLAFLTVIRVFFPLYTPLRYILSTIYPVNSIKKYLIENIKDWFSYYFIVVISFLCFLPVFSKEYNYVFCLKLLLLVFSFNIIRRIIQSLIEKKVLFSTKYLILFLLLLIALIGTEIFSPIYHSNLFVDVVKFGILFVLGMIMEYKLTRKELSQKTLPEGEEKMLRNLLLRNKMLYLVLIAVLIIKITFLLLDSTYLRFHQVHYLEYAGIFPQMLCDIFLLILILPMFVFVYFNNLWGYCRNLFLTVRLRTDSAKDLFLWRIRLLAIPLCVDFFITNCYWFFSEGFSAFSFIQYFMCVILLICTGFYFSFRYPTYTSMKTTTGSGATSIVNILSAVFVISFSSILMMTENVAVILIVVILGIGICYACIKQGFKEYTNERMYLKLFKK